ncbi:MAG: hypothetical protein H6740_22710 [Alphaproteobacteria bacterium]|nr:hypothetical protein [Alphaproteobacteria bacterium]
MEHYSAAWADIKDNVGGWVVYALVFLVINSFTGGLGAILLMPNMFRGIKKALDGGVAPDMGDLFNFDKIGDDAVAMLIYFVAIMVGSIACGIGAIVAAILFAWIPMIAAEGRFAAADSWKVSLAHAKGAAVDIFVFQLIGGIMVSVASMLCVLPVFVALPVLLAAQWKFYEANRDEIYKLASQEGVAQIG